jgi:pilus assembly protein CpaE
MSRVLTIDDETTYHKMIAKALESLDCKIDVAEDGAQGLAMAKTLKPDLIITDVVMPDMDGYEVTRLLRREPEFAYTPILVLTAQAGLQDKLKSFEAGADEHLTKPFEPVELLVRVTALLRRAEAARTKESDVTVKGKARLIAIHSLRGGIGCSSLAVNLSIALASLWKTPTILLDLTMMAGQVALMLNATLKRTWADIARFMPDELDMDTLNTLIYRHESGLEFIAAPTYPTEAETIKAEMLTSALNLLRQNYDYVVADLAHDFGSATLPALDVADLILMVASPDMSSVRAVAAAMNTYSRLGLAPEKTKLILNATFPRSGLPKEKIEAALGIPVAATIPYTPDLFVEAINLGQPLVYHKPHEAIAGFLEDFAFLASKDLQKKTKPEYPTETWKRVYKRFSERRKK